VTIPVMDDFCNPKSGFTLPLRLRLYDQHNAPLPSPPLKGKPAIGRSKSAAGTYRSLGPKPLTLTILQKTSQLYLAKPDDPDPPNESRTNQKTIAALTRRFIPHRLHLRRYPELFRRKSTGDNPTHIHLPRFPGIAPHVVSTTSPRKIYHKFSRSVWAGLKEYECVAGICDLPDHGDLVRKDFRR